MLTIVSLTLRPPKEFMVSADPPGTFKTVLDSAGGAGRVELRFRPTVTISDDPTAGRTFLVTLRMDLIGGSDEAGDLDPDHIASLRKVLRDSMVMRLNLSEGNVEPKGWNSGGPDLSYAWTAQLKEAGSHLAILEKQIRLPGADDDTSNRIEVPLTVLGAPMGMLDIVSLAMTFTGLLLTTVGLYFGWREHQRAEQAKEKAASSAYRRTRGQKPRP